MKPTLTSSGNRASREEIQSLEQELGASLPQDYVNYLLKWNGGTVFPAYCPVYGSWRDEYCLVHLVFDLLEVKWNLSVFAERIAPDFLPIGCDPGGCLFCVKIRGDALGCIFWWDRSEEEPRNRQRIFFVAPSFTEWLRSLCEDPYEDT